MHAYHHHDIITSAEGPQLDQPTRPKNDACRSYISGIVTMRGCCSVTCVKTCGLQAVELLREIASVEPVVYEQQQQADAAGVRSVAGFIAELADR